MAHRGLGGRGGQVSLSLDSDREVLKLYIRLFDVRFSNAALKIGLEID